MHHIYVVIHHVYVGESSAKPVSPQIQHFYVAAPARAG